MSPLQVESIYIYIPIMSPFIFIPLQVFGKDSAPLLHCIAMAPYYLNVLRK